MRLSCCTAAFSFVMSTLVFVFYAITIASPNPAKAESVDPVSYFGDTSLEVAICLGTPGRGCISVDGSYAMPPGTRVTTGDITGLARDRDFVFIHRPDMPDGCCWYMPTTFAPGKDFLKVRDKLRGRWADSTIFGFNVIISQTNFNESVRFVEQYQLWPRCFAKLDAEPSGGAQVESPKIECSFMHDQPYWGETIESIKRCPKQGGHYDFSGKEFVCINWWTTGVSYY